jgi:hypothetical protein
MAASRFSAELWLSWLSQLAEDGIKGASVAQAVPDVSWPTGWAVYLVANQRAKRTWK